MAPNHIKVAVIANKNARSVTGGAIEDIRSAITDEQLLLSSSLKESRKIASRIIENNFGVVVSAGGDGAFSQTVTDVIAEAESRGKPLPVFGVLRLGTGNGVASALGVAPFDRKNLCAELQKAKDPEARVNMSVLKINNRYAPFAGTGLDASILRDYKFIRTILNRVPLLPEKGRGAIDYTLAITTMSFWRHVFSNLPQVAVKNGNAKAYRLARDGQRVGAAKAPGEMLYKGPAIFCSASTVRYYGFDVPIFPQAATLHGGYFQLRICAMKAQEIFPKLPDVFNGTFFGDKLWDFACKDVIIETAGEQPFQVGGDAIGKHSVVRINSIEIKAVQGSAAAAPEPPK